MWLKPSEIMFSQKTINNYFDRKSRHSRTLIGETLDNLCAGRCKITDIPTISVMKRDGKWVTSDNRRLWLFRNMERLGKCETIPVNRTYHIDPRKLKSTNGGVRVKVRDDYPGGRWHTKSSVVFPQSIKIDTSAKESCESNTDNSDSEARNETNDTEVEMQMPKSEVTENSKGDKKRKEEDGTIVDPTVLYSRLIKSDTSTKERCESNTNNSDIEARTKTNDIEIKMQIYRPEVTKKRDEKWKEDDCIIVVPKVGFPQSFKTQTSTEELCVSNTENLDTEARNETNDTEIEIQICSPEVAEKRDEKRKEDDCTIVVPTAGFLQSFKTDTSTKEHCESNTDNSDTEARNETNDTEIEIQMCSPEVTENSKEDEKRKREDSTIVVQKQKRQKKDQH